MKHEITCKNDRDTPECMYRPQGSVTGYIIKRLDVGQKKRRDRNKNNAKSQIHEQRVLKGRAIAGK